MKRLVISALIYALLVSGTGAMVSMKRATVEGVIVTSSGKPADHALVIVKDFWAGTLSMQEREVARFTTDSQGRFSVANLLYRHELDFYIPERRCQWWTGNKRIRPEERLEDGTYRVRFELLADDDCPQAADSAKP